MRFCVVHDAMQAAEQEYRRKARIVDRPCAGGSTCL